MLCGVFGCGVVEEVQLMKDLLWLGKFFDSDVDTELKLDVVEAAGMLIVVNAGLLMLI